MSMIGLDQEALYEIIKHSASNPLSVGYEVTLSDEAKFTITQEVLDTIITVFQDYKKNSEEGTYSVNGRTVNTNKFKDEMPDLYSIFDTTISSLLETTTEPVKEPEAEITEPESFIEKTIFNEESFEDYLSKLGKEIVNVDELINGLKDTYDEVSIKTYLSDKLGVKEDTPEFNNPHFVPTEDLSELSTDTTEISDINDDAIEYDVFEEEDLSYVIDAVAQNFINDFTKQIVDKPVNEMPNQVVLEGIDYAGIPEENVAAVKNEIVNVLSKYYDYHDGNLALKFFFKKEGFVVKDSEKEIMREILWNGEEYYINKVVVEDFAKNQGIDLAVASFQEQYKDNPETLNVFIEIINEFNQKLAETTEVVKIEEPFIEEIEQPDLIVEGSGNILLDLLITPEQYDTLSNSDKNNFEQIYEYDKEENALGAAFYLNKMVLAEKAKTMDEREIINEVAPKFKNNWIGAEGLAILIDEACNKAFVESIAESNFTKDNIGDAIIELGENIANKKNVELSKLLMSIIQGFSTTESIDGFLNRNVDKRAFCDYNKDKNIFHIEGVDIEKLSYTLVLDTFVSVFEKHKEQIEKDYFEKLKKENVFEKDIIKGSDFQTPITYLSGLALDKLKQEGYKELIPEKESFSTVDKSFSKNPEILKEKPHREIDTERSLIKAIWYSVGRHLSLQNINTVRLSIDDLSAGLSDDQFVNDRVFYPLMSGFNYNDTYKKVKAVGELLYDYLQHFDTNRFNEMDVSKALTPEELLFINKSITNETKQLTNLEKNMIMRVGEFIDAGYKTLDKAKETMDKKVKEMSDKFTENGMIDVINESLAKYNELLEESNKKINRTIDDMDKLMDSMANAKRRERTEKK